VDEIALAEEEAARKAKEQALLEEGEKLPEVIVAVEYMEKNAVNFKINKHLDP